MAQASAQTPNETVPADAIQPRLTRLELIGFKSFASRTLFQFERGITAIIGPNGSGKSNIADAVRWALGETSYSTLRGKKTEDVIFAGGHGRAPAGMAEVTLTFDNATGWLPIDFAEVTVTRRAFRSGETAYLINGRKVRLKDVHQLTASLGQSYTVVGQGLIDSALSQRAEDRRGLFEHAADLAGLRLKASDAERNLAEADANAARLTDILSEVEPRLKSLERAARQANEYRDLRDRLRTVQRDHFRRLLRDVSDRLGAIEQNAESGAAAAEAARKRHETLVADVAALRLQRDTGNEMLVRHKAGLAESTEQLRRLRHQREIAGERISALRRRKDDLDETQRGLDAQVATVEADLSSLRANLRDVVAAFDAARLHFEQANADLTAERSARAASDAERIRLMALVADRERQIADASRRRALLVQRTETDAAERARLDAGEPERALRFQKLDAELVALNQVEETSGFRLASIDAGIVELQTKLAVLNTSLKTATDEAQTGDRELARAQAHLRELTRMHQTGAGLFAGVRAVLAAGKNRQLAGIRGTIAELIALPAQFETAVEVSLASHLQDIVVERWEQAEAAIALLKQTNAGRATFQPIDTVRGKPTPESVLAEVRTVPGVHGIAADLVDTPADLKGIVVALLGRTLIVDDLPVARACLPHLPGGWNAITLTGEIVRTSGSVTGGTAIRESGALGRERELRELPGEIAKLEKDLTKARTRVDAASKEIREASEQRQQMESERAAILATRRERSGQRERINTWIVEWNRDQEALSTRLAELDRSGSETGKQLEDLDIELAGLTSERNAGRAAIDALVATVPGDSGQTSSAELAFRDAERQIVAIEERLNAERRSEAALISQQNTLGQERAVRAERGAGMMGEISAIEAEIERTDAEIAVIEEAVEIATQDLDPLIDEYDATVERLAKTETALEREREGLIEAERNRGQSGVDVERVRGEEYALRQRILDELDLDDPTVLLEEDQTPGEPNRDSEDAEREIARLKERLRRVGYAGENAIEDYERENERYRFLSEQMADVTGAAASIRTMLEDVRTTMQDRFEVTFNRVSAVFSETFATLFGGGQARLILNDDADGKPGGVDIVAQPPGKRLQSLALLSGGERALTGAALLFAILRVNPTPFCLLDEVDAALDEANVVRFRDQLGQLAAETQAIIITHNRGTIEVANTLYGVSMRDDGASTVLSLRLSDVVLND
jgi:chromosome segregation protein